MHELVSNQPWAKSKWVIDQSECVIFFVMLSLFHFTLGVGEGGGGVTQEKSGWEMWGMSFKTEP